MALRFVIGRAGTGKTRHCFDAIAASMRHDPLGPPIYWLLPKQATFQAERALTTLAGLDAFCRARVLSFELLGEEVLAGCGGAAVPEVSAIGRQMLIGHLLRTQQDELGFFRGVARHPGLAARLDATFAEFERCGRDPAALAEVIDQLGGAGAGETGDVEADLLRRKLIDFHRLFKAYRDALGDERVDPHRRLEQVLACIADHGALRGASVYIDGFYEYTERERRMIVAIARSAASVDITVLADPSRPTIADVHHLPDELSLFHRTESQYRLLVLALRAEGIAVEPPRILRGPLRFQNEALKAIERSLFDGQREQHPPQSLRLIEAPDRRSEVDAIARRIRAMLSTGLRYRDMAVLVRSIDDYDELISASFREHDIPYFVDRRYSASHHPLIQFTRSAFQVAAHHWPHDAVMALVKSGLAGIAPQAADQLENYVLEHRLRGGAAWTEAEPWTFRRSTLRSREDSDGVIEERVESAAMDALRRQLAERLAPFTAVLYRSPVAPTLREVVVALFELYEAFDVRGTIGRWIDEAAAANEPEQRGEHEQVWTELAALFDQLVDLLGDVRIELADVLEILDVGLEQFDLALTPPRLDQVLVGQVDRTRTPPLDTVFLLGLAEGQFPRIAREDSVLSDGERRSLRSRNLDIDPESRRKLLDENLFGYIAFTRASKRLIVSRPAAQDNKPINPSSFWQRMTDMFPKLEATREKREFDADADAIGTPRQLVTRLMRWAREPDDAADAQSPWAQLYQFLAQHPDCVDPIGIMRYRAWRAVGYRNDAALSAVTAARLVPGPLRASVTRIETFASCPFKHFARYDLGLSTREDQDVTAMDLGNVYHNILERIVNRMLRERTDWCEMETATTHDAIAHYAAEIGRSLRGELMLSTARNQYLLDRVARTLERVCATQKSVLARGKFRPLAAELSFGFEHSQLPPLAIATPRGREVLLSGKIDRVDHVAAGNEVAVIDYKMPEKRLHLDQVYHGLSLQLLTYLLVLQAGGEKVFQKQVTPVAAFYAKLIRSIERITHPDDALEPDDPLFDLRSKPRGIFDVRFLEKLDETIAPGSASDILQVRINKDGRVGNLNASDAAEAGAFAALLKHVEKRIAELADELIGGTVAVRPYRMGNVTPCPNCDYRSVCRFDPGINRYHTIAPMKRADVLEILAEGAATHPGDDDGA